MAGLTLSMYPLSYAASHRRRRTARGSPSKVDPSGSLMSQNMRAAPWCWGRHGRIWNVSGSGTAVQSDSSTAAKPSIDEPSKPSPSIMASSSSPGVAAKDLRLPSVSVNQNWMKWTSRSSTVRSTYSTSFCIAGMALPSTSAPAGQAANETSRF